MREGETKVVVEGVIIGQVPTTKREEEEEGEEEDISRTCCIPSGISSLSLRGERQRSFSRPFHDCEPTKS